MTDLVVNLHELGSIISDLRLELLCLTKETCIFLIQVAARRKLIFICHAKIVLAYPL